MVGVWGVGCGGGGVGVGGVGGAWLYAATPPGWSYPTMQEVGSHIALEP